MARGTTIPKDEATDCNKKSRYHVEELKSLEKYEKLKKYQKLKKLKIFPHWSIQGLFSGFEQNSTYFLDEQSAVNTRIRRRRC